MLVELGDGITVANLKIRFGTAGRDASASLGEQGSLAAVDAHDRPATEDPSWIGSRWKDLEPTAVLAFEVAKCAGRGEVVGAVGAAAGAILDVVEGHVALMADWTGAAVAISAVDRFPFV